MRRFVRQPLVHFLLIGAVIFAVDAWRSPHGAPGEEVIHVSPSRINALASSWEARRMRPPDSAELRDLIEGYVREEILYREARKLGLDQDDTVVRRRLAQKMEFLYRDLQPIRPPDEKTLRAYYRAHAERYREPPTLTFSQLFFSPDRRGEDAVSSARTALTSLRKGQTVTESRLGDPTMLEYTYEEVSPRNIRDRFGEYFASMLMELPTGEWQGPVESAYGFHLVFIEERREARSPGFEQARRDVLRDYMREQEEKSERAFYEQLRRNYSVYIETVDIGKGTAQAGGR